MVLIRTVAPSREGANRAANKAVNRKVHFITFYSKCYAGLTTTTGAAIGLRGEEMRLEARGLRDKLNKTTRPDADLPKIFAAASSIEVNSFKSNPS